MPDPNRVALVRSGDRPRVNASLAAKLAATFPEYQVDDIDVLDSVRSDRPRMALAAVTGIAEHAGSLALRRITPKRAMVGSRGFAAAASRCVRSTVSPATHRFVFQSQSLFDASVDGVPHFVYTDHAHLANLGYPGFDRSSLRSARYLRTEAEMYASAAMIFTRSEHVRDMIVHGYRRPPDQVAVVGVGPNADTSVMADHEGWYGGRILFVGVDWERKGGPDLVAAFRRLRVTHPTARLDIVGCSPQGVTGDGIVVHGRRSLDEVGSLMAQCDVFCLPTVAEPFGVAFIEAMHAGLPVVGTDLGAIPDFTRPGETGALVRPHDVDALHDVLTDLVADPDRTQRLGANARAVARSRYDWPVVMSTIRSHIEAWFDRTQAPPR